MQEQSSNKGRRAPSPPVARDARGGPRRGTCQPWHDLASTLVDIASRGEGVGVTRAVVARASENTGLSPASISGMMSAARYVRDSGYGGPVLASVDSVMALRSLATVDPDRAARLLDAVMAGQATRRDLVPGPARARASRAKAPRVANEAKAPPALSALRPTPGMALH